MDLKSLIPFGRTGLSRGPAEFDPFATMRRDIDRVFDEFTRDLGRDWALPAFRGNGFLTPRVDVAETDTGLELTADLPGVDPKDISLDLADGVLTLKASTETQKDEKDDAKHYHLVERASGTFMRRFALPFAPDTGKVAASFDKGVLKVTVPRSATEPKDTTHIEIKAA
jgi:HSP20 family protein